MEAFSVLLEKTAWFKTNCVCFQIEKSEEKAEIRKLL